MEFPRLSVVLPNFNHARYLPECLTALLEQSVPPFEVIVVDDASTDHSLEVLGDIARKHSTVRIYRNEKNQGVVYGMNRGLDLARGDYLFFHAADDQVQPGMFEKSLRLLAEHPEAALSCTISEWHGVATGLSWHMGSGMANCPCYLSPAELVSFGKRGRLLIISHSTVFKKSALVEAGRFIPELRWHCDWFATHVAALRHGLCHVPEPLSRVNLHSQSFYGAGRQRAEHRQVLLKLLDLLRAKEYGDVAPRVRDSGALFMFALPMLRVLLTHAEDRYFMTLTLLRKAAWRSLELAGKRILPKWLARWCLELFYRSRVR